MTRKKRRKTPPRTAPRPTPAGRAGSGPRPGFWLLTLLLVLAAVAAILFAYRSLDPRRWSDELVLRFASERLAPEDKETLQRRLSSLVPGLWQPVPEAEVGYLLQPGVSKQSKGAQVVANRAGLRSRREYGPKGERFRIVLLGDSLVMGTGGPEEDRWGNQMEAILRELDVQVEGRAIEVLSLGLDGWTGLNEATYLTSRFSAYDPDIVIALMFRNDITDTGGILGNGVLTYGFSPEEREHHSGVMIGAWPSLFGIAGTNLLHAGMGSESTRRWRRTFAAWQRLEALTHQRGGEMLVAVLGRDDLFADLVRHHLETTGMTSPLIRTQYFGHRLPHDPHPDRTGHRLLAVHFLRALATRGWLPVEPTDLPDLHPELSLEAPPVLDPLQLRRRQQDLAEARLDTSIRFDALTGRQVKAILGGVYPGSARSPLGSRPFATPRAAFLLRTEPDLAAVEVEVEVPARLELFPFRLRLAVNGRPAAGLELADRSEAGVHRLRATLSPEDLGLPAQEIVLTTPSYWTEIADPVTRSYRLVEARLR